MWRGVSDCTAQQKRYVCADRKSSWIAVNIITEMLNVGASALKEAYAADVHKSDETSPPTGARTWVKRGQSEASMTAKKPIYSVCMDHNAIGTFTVEEQAYALVRTEARIHREF